MNICRKKCAKNPFSKKKYIYLRVELDNTKKTKPNNMGALTVLYLIMPLPLLFIVHDAEEIFFQHKWVIKNEERIRSRFPFANAIVDKLVKLDTASFVIAALEEWVILVVATLYLLVDGPYGHFLWESLFLAFSFHLLVHIIQAVLLKGYVPGLVTGILVLPYCMMGVKIISNDLSAIGFICCLLLGVSGVVVNLKFAHYIGMKGKKYLLPSLLED